jgi:cytochrome c5
MNMKRLFISLATITLFSFFFVSCYYDNEEALYPALSNSCDTTNVTYSGSIVPILNNSCLTCHSNASTGGSIVLTTYAEVVASAPRITGSIKQLSGFSAMPKNGGKIKSCSISQWDIWVKNGMLNN